MFTIFLLDLMRFSKIIENKNFQHYSRNSHSVLNIIMARMRYLLALQSIISYFEEQQHLAERFDAMLFL